MTFFLLGIDHNTAPIDVREAVYWKRKEIAAFWAHSESAILATCNRFEIYAIAASAPEAEQKADLFRRSFGRLFDKSYFLLGRDNILKHLALLAAGLKSQIRGELQISSQLGAWAAREEIPANLSRLVHQALLAALEIRAAAGLKGPENNIAALLYRNLLGQNRSDDLLNVAVVGTGKIAELFAHYRPQGVRLYFAAHKNILKARQLAGASHGTAIRLKELPELLLNADILISATSSPHRVFDRNYFTKIAALRDRELYIYDLALPRDISPDVKNIKGIILKNIDEAISNVDHKSRRKAQPVSY